MGFHNNSTLKMGYLILLPKSQIFPLKMKGGNQPVCQNFILAAYIFGQPGATPRHKI